MLLLKSRSLYYKKRKIFNIFSVFEIKKNPLIIFCSLFCIGILCLVSAENGNFQSLAMKQCLFFLIFIPIFILIISINIRYLYRFSYLIYLFILLSLVFVLVVGKTSSMGAKRWINFGFFYLQPSELAKIGIIFFLSRYFSSIIYNIGSINHTIISGLAILPIISLVIIQPDLTTTAVIILLFIIMLFVSGVKIIQFIAVGIVALGLSPFAWKSLKQYQKLRIINFLNPEHDPLNSGYNIIQSKIAIGSGGFFGKGFLQGTQGQLKFLPEHHTDFVFTIIGEEFGFIGSIIFLILYFYIIYYGIITSIKTVNLFGKFLSLGVSSMFFIHGMMNIGMTMALMPVGGLPLPMISYGGTILGVSVIGFALITNVNINSEIEM